MNQSQIERVVRTWVPIIQRAIAAYTPAAPVRSTLPPLKAPVPSPAPFTAPVFDTTSWQHTNWQATLASQAAGFGVANITTQSSQSTTNGAQHQHADAPSDFTARNATPVKTPAQELATVQEQLATLRLENTELREKERTLGSLVKENSATRLHKEIELASTQKELSTLKAENSRLLQEQQRLNKLDSELAASREKVTALQSQTETLVSSQADLELLKSEHSQFISQFEAELEGIKAEREVMKAKCEAIKVELSQADTEKAHLKESLNHELATLKDSLTRGLLTLQEEHDAALIKKDLAFQALHDKHTALQQTHTATAAAHESLDHAHRELTTTLHQQAEELGQRDATLHRQAEELRQRDATLQQQTATLERQTTQLQEQAAELLQRDATLQDQTTTIQHQTTTLQQQASELQHQTATLQHQASELQQRDAALHQRDAEVQQLRADNGRLVYTLKIAEMRSMSIPQPAYAGGRTKGKGLVRRVQEWVRKLGTGV